MREVWVWTESQVLLWPNTIWTIRRLRWMSSRWLSISLQLRGEVNIGSNIGTILKDIDWAHILSIARKKDQSLSPETVPHLGVKKSKTINGNWERGWDGRKTRRVWSLVMKVFHEGVINCQMLLRGQARNHLVSSKLSFTQLYFLIFSTIILYSYFLSSLFL